MPQMYPLNWILLYIYFSLLFILFFIFMYFFYNQPLNSLNKIFNYKKKNNLNWKW